MRAREGDWGKLGTGWNPSLPGGLRALGVPCAASFGAWIRRGIMGRGGTRPYRAYLIALISERMGRKIDNATQPTNPIRNNIKAGSRIVNNFLIRRGIIWL